MALTAAEKAAARAFLARLGQALAAAGPAAPCSPYIREYRHSCPARGGASVCLRLREEYRASPGYFVPVTDGELNSASWHEKGLPPVPGTPEPGRDDVCVPAGVFAAFWKEGECAACGLKVRSTLSRLFLAAGRPPERSPSRG